MNEEVIIITIKKSEKALSQIWHVFVNPLKHCFRWQFSFLMNFFQSHRETFLQKNCTLYCHIVTQKATFKFTSVQMEF